MNFLRFGIACLIAFSLSSASSAADPLDLIHKDASMVVRLQAPANTVKDVAAFIDKIQPGFGAIVQGQASGLGMAIENPTLAGVDMNRDWYVMLFASKQAPPVPVMVIPAADVDEFTAALGNRMAVATKDDYVVYSPDSTVLEAVKSGFDSASASLSTVQSEGLLQDFQKGHLALLINSPALQTTFATELADAERMMELGLDELGREITQSGQPFPVEAMKAFYGSLGEWLIQAARDSTGAVIRLEASEVELRFDDRFVFKPSSATQKSLAKHPISPLELLSKLPADLQWYIAASADLDSVMDISKDMMNAFLTDEEAQKQFDKAFQAMKETRFQSLAGGFDLSASRKAALRYVGVIDADPTATLREAFAAMGESQEYQIAGITQKISYRKNAESVAGREVDLYEFTQTIPPEMDPMGIQSAINNRLYGGNVISQRLVFDPTRMYQVLGGTPQDLEELLSATQSTDSKLLEARKRLYAEANFVSITDVPNLLVQIATLVTEAPGLPIPISSEQLSELKVKTTYAGSCLSLADGEVNGRLNLPVEMFQEIVKAVFTIQQSLN